MKTVRMTALLVAAIAALMLNLAIATPTASAKNFCGGAGDGCNYGQDCCSGDCYQSACTCSQIGSDCNNDGDCCGGGAGVYCVGGTCSGQMDVCRNNGDSCDSDYNCCSNHCCNGTCTLDTCTSSCYGAPCTSDAQCCMFDPVCIGGVPPNTVGSCY